MRAPLEEKGKSSFFANFRTATRTVSQFIRFSFDPSATMSHDASSMRASHLLVKHSGSRRAASHLDPAGARIKATTKDQAVATLLAYRQRITAGESFADLAKKYSDCSSGAKGGDLGVFSRGAMQKPFEDATLALNLGELSQARRMVLVCACVVPDFTHVCERCRWWTRRAACT